MLFKSHWKRILIWFATIAFLVGVCGLFVVNYAVEKIMDTIVSGLQLQSQAEFEAQLQEQLISEKKSSTQSENREESWSSEDAKIPDTIPQYIPESGTSSVVSLTPNASNLKHPSSPVSVLQIPQSGVTNNDDEAFTYSPEVSPSKAEAIKNQVTLKDKVTVTSILAGKISMSEIKFFQEMAIGGLSIEEKRAARKVMLEKLSSEEYDALIEIAKKYGLSEGKKYSEVITEEQKAENK